jgi:putative tricarboxylic transport membrane protein
VDIPFQLSQNQKPMSTIRVFVTGTLLALCAAWVPVRGAEPAWKPQRNVELVVGAQAGGSNDRMARLLQKILTESGAAPAMTVVNKPGQGQVLAAVYVNSHPGDPHYLLMLGSSWVSSSIVTRSTTTHRDFTPITKLIDGDLVVFVPADSAIRTVRDLGDGLRRDASQYSFGFSTSAGNSSHIALVELARHAGADPRKLRVVVNASGGITATQVAGGHIAVGVSSSGSVQAMVALGKVRMIGAISSQRLPQLPNLPTLREQGYDVVASTWFVMFGPKGLSGSQVAYWEDAIGKAMRHPETKQFADANNWTIELVGSRELPAELDKEYARLRATLTELGMVK